LAEALLGFSDAEDLRGWLAAQGNVSKVREAKGA
jgi:hypothetical protein